jgi:hypothetical protein
MNRVAGIKDAEPKTDLDGQRAQYDTKTKHIHISGPSGRRVIERD